MEPLGRSPERRLRFSRNPPVSTLLPSFSNDNRLIKIREINEPEDSTSTKKNQDNNEKDHDKDEKKTSGKTTKSAEKAEHDSAKVLAEEVTITGTHATVYSIGYNPDYTFTSPPQPRPSPPTTSPTATPSHTFVPLPPLPSALSENTSGSRATFSASPAASAEASPTQSHPAAQSRKGIPIAAIATLAVGSALLLVGVIIIIKACSRPRQRTRPKPSLPILADPFADDQPFDIKEKDSPVFGGKERFSSQNGLWTLVNYPPTAVLPAPSQAAGLARNLGDDEPSNDIPRSQLPSHPMHSQSVPSLVVSKATAPYQNSLARAVSRFSTASLSLYPQSPISAQDIGIAIGSSKAFTADGHPIMKRTPKAALRRSKSDVLDKMELGAYDGADVTSPKFAPHFLEAPSVPVAVGRTRIKSSYYTPGSYPRISTIPSTSKIRAENADPFASQKLPPLSRPDSRRNRDTKALASAIGLTSPSVDRMPPSPQPTIYPDDSLSVVDTKRRSKRVPKRSKYSLGGDEFQRQSISGFQMSKEVDTSALGTMMLNMDFGATNKSLVTLAGRLGENLSYGDISGSSGTLSGAQFRGASDKPPRVPSPPPLPSLTQMGLEHANPETYANYRSPTYSIFGLYEDERKSSYHYR
ncbi:hypothetical protein EV421DRAFT_1776843 [Armillaria borealis]|uniref:Uncharacterized protein n=1 Tax=Armillaria borealis TaxID=47425 RepID=A0AA39JY98_9AGAR|nr:hypothetical protein EV421DRAFT_1776843 [Armillaria borealis]